MQKSYINLAKFYDKLFSKEEYQMRASYVMELLKEYNIFDGLVLDLACGTGKITSILSKNGYDMIGVDSSFEMLNIAREENNSALFLQQDMESFELYGTVRAVICLTDSLNYLADEAAINNVFSLVNNYLDDDGIFIFDINTKHRLKYEYAGNVFADQSEDITYIWQNYYDIEKDICEFDISFFMKDGDIYNRYDEVHIQKAFLDREIKNALKKNNFYLLAMYDDLTKDIPKKRSSKVFYIAKVDKKSKGKEKVSLKD